LGLHTLKSPTRFREDPIFDVKLETDVSDIRGVMAETFGWLAKHFDTSRVAAVGHRVVHGGESYAGPVRIDDATIEALDKLTMLAPLHQPQALRLIRAIRELRPDLPQSASFDTAFHRTNTDYPTNISPES
jgi:acetate kinase